MSELHHPHCPRYFLDGREIECSASPACKCRECEDCEGEGYFVVDDTEDWKYGEMTDCESCEGLGRVLR